jgi:TFIIF-interacting CTD phosphatase-like protein
MKQLLPPQDKKYKGKKTLVLDLDETLVHAKFTETVQQKSDLFFEIFLNSTRLP